MWLRGEFKETRRRENQTKLGKRRGEKKRISKDPRTLGVAWGEGGERAQKAWRKGGGRAGGALSIWRKEQFIRQ